MGVPDPNKNGKAACDLISTSLQTLEMQKGVYFQIVNWFHGAGQKV